MAVVPMPAAQGNWMQALRDQTSISATQAQTAERRVKLKEWIDNVDVRKAVGQAKKVKAEEFVTPQMQQARQLKTQNDILDATGNILQTTAPDNYNETREMLGPIAERLKLPEQYDPRAITEAVGGIRNNMEYLRAVGKELETREQEYPKPGKELAFDSKGRAFPTYNYKGHRFVQAEGGLEMYDEDKYTLTEASSQVDPFKPTKPTANMLQKDLVSGLNQLERLEGVGEAFADEYLTWAGKAKASIGSNLEKAGWIGRKINEFQKHAVDAADRVTDFVGLEDAIEGGGEDWIKFAAERRNFSFQVEQFFNEYRHSITGAQASYQEIQYLKQATLNQDLSASEFYTVMQSVVGNLKSRFKRTSELLEQGLRVENGWTYDEKEKEWKVEEKLYSVDSGRQYNMKSLPNGVEYEVEEYGN